jgi:hypothetical protein
MNTDLRAKLTIKRLAIVVLLTASPWALIGCQPRRIIELRYRPNPDHRELLEPSRIAVLKPPPALDNLKHVGLVFDLNGNVIQRLQLPDPSAALTGLLAEALDHKGLKPVISAGPELPDGVDYMVTCAPQKLDVVRRVDRGPDGETFLIGAAARITCSLTNRQGQVLVNSDFAGTDNEPPVGDQHSRPVLSDPADALSAAVSYAADTFLSSPQFPGAAGGQRSAGGATASSTPAATASPTATATPIQR